MIKICDRHGPYETQEVVILGMHFEINCPQCELEKAEKESKENAIIAARNLQTDFLRRGIEEEYFSASLEKYIAENESERKALEAVKELESGEISKLLLLGSNGVGKTFLSCALAIKLHGVRLTMYELSAKIRAGFNRGECELDFLNSLLDFPLIVLDEIGRTKGSEAEKNWLSYLIDKAHTRKIKLLLISNRHLAKSLPADRKGEAIENFFDNDVISRLRQDSKIVEVIGRDRRAPAVAL